MPDLHADQNPRGANHRPEDRRWPEAELAPRLHPWADPQARDRIDGSPGRFDRQIEADVLRNLARMGF
ncbi:hypothetical protein [Thiocystis violacea]|uniref:hypothetical protein n=1 Tax=Thiocystis violacea TaxID=13725 RepID=UPI001904B935|nr:hypothetical protein [Thiocystis violacea]MBK1717126.1 hypothetical protein [Thiocystis violacea]